MPVSVVAVRVMSMIVRVLVHVLVVPVLARSVLGALVPAGRLLVVTAALGHVSILAVQPLARVDAVVGF